MAENIDDPNKNLLMMEQYSTQYFGFTLKSFCNGIYNAMNEYLSECIKAVMEFMTTEFDDILSPHQVEIGISKILSLYSDVFDKQFDRFELYLYKNIFHIPSNVLLPEDEVQTTVVTKLDEESVDDAITMLELEIWAVKIANARLREELVDLDISQKQLDSTLAKLDELRNLMAEAGVAHPHEALLATEENIVRSKQLIAKITNNSPSSPTFDGISILAYGRYNRKLQIERENNLKKAEDLRIKETSTKSIKITIPQLSQKMNTKKMKQQQKLSDIY